MEKYNLIHAQITELYASIQLQKQEQNHSQSAYSNATYIDPMTLLQEIKNVETSGLIARKSTGNVLRLA